MLQRVASGWVVVFTLLVVLTLVCDGAGTAATTSSTTPWTPASPALHLFFDLEGLASVDGLKLKQHRAIKPPSGDFVIAATEPWEPLVFAYDSVVQVCMEVGAMLGGVLLSCLGASPSPLAQTGRFVTVGDVASEQVPLPLSKSLCRQFVGVTCVPWCCSGSTAVVG